MNVGSVLTDIGEGLVNFIPSLGQAIWNLFMNMFLTTSGEPGSETVEGFNVLGIMALVSLIIGLAYKLIPMVANWISKKVQAAKRRKAKA